MKLFLFILVFISSFAHALAPKLVCQTQPEKNGRYFRIDIVYSPYYQSTHVEIAYQSEYGLEAVSKVALKKPGYTTSDIYFGERQFDLNFPNSSAPVSSITYLPFKMVINKNSLSGTVQFQKSGSQNQKVYNLKVSCNKSLWPNL